MSKGCSQKVPEHDSREQHQSLTKKLTARAQLSVSNATYQQLLWVSDFPFLNQIAYIGYLMSF